MKDQKKYYLRKMMKKMGTEKTSFAMVAESVLGQGCYRTALRCKWERIKTESTGRLEVLGLLSKELKGRRRRAKLEQLIKYIGAVREGTLGENLDYGHFRPARYR